MSKSIDEMLGDPVKEWHNQTLKEYKGPVPTLVFTNTIADGKKLEGDYQAAGFRFVQVSANDTPSLKKQKIRDLKRGYIHGLISCTMLERGFNEPDIQCVQLFRRYRKTSAVCYRLLAGGCAGQAGKEDCLVIDHSGNLEGYAPEIAYVYENGFHDLDMSERKVRIREGKERERKESKCPKCGSVLIRRAKNCDTCGYAFSEQESKAITVAAVFRQIDLRNPDHIGSMDRSERGDLWNQLCALGAERHKYDAHGQRSTRLHSGVRSWDGGSTAKSYEKRRSVEVTQEVRSTVNANFQRWKGDTSG